MRNHLPDPKVCPACHDRRIKPYHILYSVADDDGQVVTFQCYGCGSLLEPGTRETFIVGYAPVVLVGGLKGEPPHRARSS
jgi:hypothetical protein